MASEYHIPVMLEEVLKFLNPAPGKIIVDATLGTAGHSLEILERIAPLGKLIGIDRDENAVRVAQQRLKKFNSCSELIQGNFIDLDKILAGLNIKEIDGIIFDLGVSSLQLQDPARGFSFQNEGPLDMRLDQNSQISAYDLVNNLNEEELSRLLWDFGEERWHNRIARNLVAQRLRHPILTTSELSQIVTQAIPSRYRYSRIHPATRTFQAVRIAVNRELEALQGAIGKAVELLKEKAKICIISFHSLEDRIVKLSFKELASQGKINIITPKPLQAQEAEVANNPRSRSAKLRVAERS